MNNTVNVEKVESKFFFCYSRNLADYLRYEHGIKYITAAKQIHSNKVFYLFERTPALQAAMDQRQVG